MTGSITATVNYIQNLITENLFLYFLQCSYYTCAGKYKLFLQIKNVSHKTYACIDAEYLQKILILLPKHTGPSPLFTQAEQNT